MKATTKPPTENQLYYVADPMCSWCYGFAPQWELVRAALSERPDPLPIRWLMGGLAPDSDVPMDASTRSYVQSAWHAVSEATGVSFNHDFWKVCEPRRSTYPACRAFLSAESLRSNAGPEMFSAIQRAYYVEARNPSDTTVLVSLGTDLGFDAEGFEAQLKSQEIESELRSHRDQVQSLGAQGFPSLVLQSQGRNIPIMRGFLDAKSVLDRLSAALAKG